MLNARTEKTERIPLRSDSQGAARVGGTQVTLDVLMHCYDQGATPEQISQKFGELRLDDVYAVITYYLRHTEEVRAYLAERSREAEELRRQAEAVSASGTIRERLRQVKRDRQERAG
jgi:uncharacterized protein (DUF433 family)